jgi:hypothetical protein
MYNKKRHSEKIQMKKTYVSLCLISFFICSKGFYQGHLFESKAGWHNRDTSLGMQEDLIDCKWNWIQRTTTKKNQKTTGILSLIDQPGVQVSKRHKNTWTQTTDIHTSNNDNGIDIDLLVDNRQQSKYRIHRNVKYNPVGIV